MGLRKNWNKGLSTTRVFSFLTSGILFTMFSIYLIKVRFSQQEESLATNSSVLLLALKNDLLTIPIS